MESKKDILEHLRIEFTKLALEAKGGRGRRNQNSGQYTPCPVKMKAMADSIEAKAILDPTRLVGESLEDALGLGD